MKKSIRLILWVILIIPFFASAQTTITSKIFKVSFTNVPDSAQKTFMYGISILERHFKSPQIINVAVYWQESGNSYAKSTLNILGDSTFPVSHIFYPVSLAEKIANKNYNNPNDADIECRLNKKFKWYYGHDGNPPKDGIDLVTFVLHEMCHGLGIVCSFKVENGNGYYGFDNDKTGYIPLIYDRYIINESGDFLIDTSKFKNYSTELSTQLKTGKKYFTGPIAKKNNNNQGVHLYVPPTFDPGGTLSHFDTATFKAINPDGLMTPFYTIAYRDIGPLMSAVLSDIGWTHTYIIPDIHKDIEPTNQPIDISTTIISDSGFFANSARVIYSTDNFVTRQSIPLTLNAGKYTAAIPAPNKVADVLYYFSVKDSFDRIFRMPSDSSLKPFRFHCGPDTKKPIVRHDSLTFIYSDFSSMKIKAQVSDNIGVDSVVLEYFINTTKKSNIVFVHDSLNEYTGEILFNAGDIKVGDSILYRIWAVDSSMNHNKIILPSKGYFVTRVEKRPPLITYYKNNFDSLSNDFILTGFTINKEVGFSNAALNTLHPYLGTGKAQVYKEYIAELKPQVKILSVGSYMMFDEIALVEPNIEGKIFGEFGFYDYVIVEGSKDEKNWFAFENTGYNCRYNNDWQVKFSSTKDKNENSLAKGDPSLYRRHFINLRNNKALRAGDSIHVRFRLHSDAYITGWGWAIDNLVIQDTVAYSLPNPMLAMQVYPNPGNDFVNINIPSNDQAGQTIEIADITGRIMFQENMKASFVTLNTSSFPDGIYLLIISDSRRNTIAKTKMIIQH